VVLYQQDTAIGNAPQQQTEKAQNYTNHPGIFRKFRQWRLASCFCRIDEKVILWQAVKSGC